MINWKSCKLGDTVNLKRGYDLPSQKRVKGAVPLYSSSGVSDYQAVALKEGPGVITGRYGTVGQVFFSEGAYWPLNTTLYVQDFKGNLPKFIYYFLKGLSFEKYSDKSAVPGINRNEIHSEEVLIPPLEEQARIAEVLSSLDDKIDFLHRQNRTLEQLAQTLFRHWFVEQAKPQWNEQGLDTVAVFLNGLPCQKFPPVSGEPSLPVIKIRELRQGFTEESDVSMADVPRPYVIENGDLVFSWSGSLELVVWSYGTGVLNQHLFKVTSNAYPQWFIYHWIQHHLPELRGIAEDKATTMGHIQRSHLTAAQVLVPSDSELKQFGETMEPLFEKRLQNLLQVRTLSSLRDTLLPKLMSGEVRVTM